MRGASKDLRPRPPIQRNTEWREKRTILGAVLPSTMGRSAMIERTYFYFDVISTCDKWPADGSQGLWMFKSARLQWRWWRMINQHKIYSCCRWHCIQQCTVLTTLRFVMSWYCSFKGNEAEDLHSTLLTNVGWLSQSSQVQSRLSNSALCRYRRLMLAMLHNTRIKNIETISWIRGTISSYPSHAYRLMPKAESHKKKKSSRLKSSTTVIQK